MYVGHTGTEAYTQIYDGIHLDFSRKEMYKFVWHTP